MTTYLVTVTNAAGPGSIILAVEAESGPDAQVAAVHRCFREMGWWNCTASAAVGAEIVHVEDMALHPELVGRDMGDEM